MPETRDFAAVQARLEDALRLSDLAAARAAAAAAQAMASTEGERVIAQLMLARCEYVAGNPVTALPLALEAAAAAAKIDPVTESRARALLARCLRAGGETQLALEEALTAVRLVDALNEDRADAEVERVRMLARTALGVVYLGLQQLEAALDWCGRARQSAAALGDAVALGAAFDTMACVQGALAARERAAGRADLAERWEREAEAHSREAVRIARENGHVEYEATALNNLAETLALLGRADEALVLLEEWAERSPAVLPQIRAHHLDTRGIVCLAMGRAAPARDWFQEALRLTQDTSFRLVVTEHLADALERCGDWRGALQAQKQFHALYVQLSAEQAQRSASMAEVRLQTEQQRARASALDQRNRALRRRAEDLERQSLTDALTGLPNRRRLDQLLAEGVDDNCLALIDVDHFKQINDRHSHAVGDEVLRRLAGLLRSSCREGDLPARLGGEEFVVVLKHLPLEAAAAAAERLRLLVAGHDWHALAPGLAVTVSIGLARGTAATSGRELLALADHRLYAAKRNGRNRLVQTG